MKKSELEEKVQILEVENHDLKQSIKKMISEAYKSGENLKSQPFIPEYLGFDETIIKNESTGGLEARVYTKAGFNIARPVDIDEKGWRILPPNKKEAIYVELKNMYNAIVILESIGIDGISLENYFEESIKKSAEIDEKIKNELEKSK